MSFVCCSLSPSSLPPVLPRREFRSPDAGGRTLLAGVGGVESNFMMLSTPTITAADHPDLPAILVYIECLCALEVYMYEYNLISDSTISIPGSRVQCGVRFVEWDSPITTGCHVLQRVGRCTFSCSSHLSWYRPTKWPGRSWYSSLSLSPFLPPSISLCPSLPLSSSIPLSFTFFLQVKIYHFFFIFALPQSGYLSGSTPFDEVQLESAISGVIYEIIEREKTVSHAASNALMCYLKQVDNSHNRCAPSRLQCLQAVLLSFSLNISVFLKFYQYLW